MISKVMKSFSDPSYDGYMDDWQVHAERRQLSNADGNLLSLHKGNQMDFPKKATSPYLSNSKGF